MATVNELDPTELVENGVLLPAVAGPAPAAKPHAWVWDPGEEGGKRVDDVIARMRRELGPLIVRDREAEKAAERERLGGEIRGSIARRLRKAGAVRSDGE
ncbi:hypothetical protein ACFU98_39825 [Streptomyces sp. NPDC057575]|uniref:hypothetical protein n=1 Tax=unclassified Streptomyces TaxID=2593676 RepID=UPI0036A88AFD